MYLRSYSYDVQAAAAAVEETNIGNFLSDAMTKLSSILVMQDGRPVQSMSNVVRELLLIAGHRSLSMSLSFQALVVLGTFSAL